MVVGEGEAHSRAPGARESRGCLGTLAVALLMFAVLGAGLATATALRDRPPVPVTVGRGVAVQPPIEWEFAARLDPAPGVDSGIVLSRGVGSLLVYVPPGDGRDALESLRNELDASSLMSTGEIETADLRAEGDAYRFAYSGVMPELAGYAVEGEAIAVQGGQVAAVFLAWTAVGDYQLVRAEVEAMISRATVP
jgi:hypothetical protein